MNSHASHSERVYEAAQPETIIGVSQSVQAEMGCAPTPAPRVAKVPPFPAAVPVSRGTLARTQLAPAPAPRAAGLLPTPAPVPVPQVWEAGAQPIAFPGLKSVRALLVSAPVPGSQVGTAGARSSLMPLQGKGSHDPACSCIRSYSLGGSVWCLVRPGSHSRSQGVKILSPTVLNVALGSCFDL